MTKVLVDTGAFVDVLYCDAFLNLKRTKEDLKPSLTLVKGFGQTEIPIAGIVALLITLGDHNNKCDFHRGAYDIRIQRDTW